MTLIKASLQEGKLCLDAPGMERLTLPEQLDGTQDNIAEFG